ncbi:MAG: hypothetical protein EOP67_12795 [Sphingomonas sp.]|nr:MAG: hypothetical protein EOP67_12795 [Sphingomonas sp.]
MESDVLPLRPIAAAHALSPATPAPESDLLARKSRLPVAAVRLRLETYDEGGRLSEALHLQWREASDVLEEAAIEFWSESIPGIDPERSASLGATMLELLRRKHTTPVDTVWVEELTAAARELYAQGLQMPVYIVGMNRHMDLVIAGMRRKFADRPDLCRRLCDAHRLTKVFELEILLAQIAWIDNDISIATRTAQGVDFHAAVRGVVEEGSVRSARLRSTMKAASRFARATEEKATTVAAAADEAAHRMCGAGSTAAEILAALRDAAMQIERSSLIAASAVVEASDAETMSNELTGQAGDIASVVSVIGQIATRTRLLSINAAIEAAHAGAAGRGFSVVAQEVKLLAELAASSTDDIAARIDTVQTAARRTVAANAAIRAGMDKVNVAATRIVEVLQAQIVTVGTIAASLDGTAAIAQSMVSTGANMREDAAIAAASIDRLERDAAFVEIGLRDLDRSTSEFVNDVSKVHLPGLRAE